MHALRIRGRSARPMSDSSFARATCVSHRRMGMHFRARCAASRQRENHIARRMGSSVRRADECSRVTWYPASSLTRSHTACPPAHTEARESGESADVTSERAALYVRSACALSRQRATRPSYYHGVGSGAFLMDKAVASSPHMVCGKRHAAQTPTSRPFQSSI